VRRKMKRIEAGGEGGRRERVVVPNRWERGEDAVYRISTVIGNSLTEGFVRSCF
jgi:SLT domain-containing protein